VAPPGPWGDSCESATVQPSVPRPSDRQEEDASKVQATEQKNNPNHASSPALSFSPPSISHNVSRQIADERGPMDFGASSPSPSPSLAPTGDVKRFKLSSSVAAAESSDVSLLRQDAAHPYHRRLGNPTTWRTRHGSIYLRRAFLIGMALLFAAFFVLVEVLNYFSNRYQGFVDTEQSKHYLWRFGPTLVLSLVAALWGQLEYQVQNAMPWMELRRRPMPAERNFLLNYRSPWSIISLFGPSRPATSPSAWPSPPGSSSRPSLSCRPVSSPPRLGL